MSRKDKKETLSSTRLPGQAGPEISEDDLRFERYSILMSFDNYDDIPITELVNHWQTSQQRVISLIGGAIRMTPDGPLADKFAKRGYPVETHPLWFGTRRQHPDKVDETSTEGDEMGAGVGEWMHERLFTPKEPLSIEQGKPRVHTQQPSSAHLGASETSNGAPRSAILESGSPTTVTLSAEQQQLLAQHNITEMNGRWSRVTPLAGGGYNVQPVDMQTELMRLERSKSGEDIMSQLGGKMINELDVITGAIMKKVALNPKVLYIYDVVSTLNDPDTQLPLYAGDIGDFIRECVEYTGRRRYGIYTAVVINDPNSDYMKMRQLKAKEQAQDIPDPIVLELANRLKERGYIT